MKIDARDGLPVIGDRFAELGVRPGKDIDTDSDGMVGPGKGGMSVRSSVEQMNFNFIPKRYAHLIDGARGDNRHELYCAGSGPFANGAFARELELRIDPSDSSHGFVEPAHFAELREYQRNLAATRDQWTVVNIAGGLA